MKTKVQFHVPPNILQIDPYKPGKPEEELIRELKLNKVYKLASNENCLGPSPRAVEACRQALLRCHRYPDGSGYYLKKALSQKLQVQETEIILGNGSTDLVEIIARTFLEPGTSTVTADQTFLMYRIATVSMNATCIAVPTRTYGYDLNGILQAIRNDTRIVYIANPNNPTGTILRQKELTSFLDELPPHILVVLDEAYFEYVEDPEFPNGLDYFRRYPNVIVLRTFSKVYGLAGMRIGYGIAGEEIILNLNRVRSPFNTSSLAQAAAIAALEDMEHVQKSIAHNRKEKAFLQNAFAEMNVPYVPSFANFIFLPITNSMRIFEEMLHQGVIVRPMKSFNQTEGLRVTIGTREENEAFLSALRQVLFKK